VNTLRILTCSICGQETLGDARWFLVMEDQWQDKLIVLHWNDRLAALGVHCTCSPEHMQELVVHWMTTGSLDYPFARTGYGAGRRDLRLRKAHSDRPRPETFGARQIGELTIHRESMERALCESPQSLRTILDALTAALQQERVLSGPGRKPQATASEIFAREA